VPSQVREIYHQLFLPITRGGLGKPLQTQLPFSCLETVKMKKYFAVPRRDAEKWMKV